MGSLLHEALRRGLAAFRTNLPGMVAVVVLGGILLTTYATVPAVHVALDRFALWKDGLGLWYPIMVFPLVGGILPVAATWLISGQRPALRTWAVIVIFWPERGLEVDFLYRGLGYCVGTGHDVGTVVIKVALDMGIYTSLWALPIQLLVLAWSHGESPLALIRSSAFWRERYLSGLIASWLLWIPGVIMIYTLPSGLQLPVQNLFLFVWVLIAATIATVHAPMVTSAQDRRPSL